MLVFLFLPAQPLGMDGIFHFNEALGKGEFAVHNLSAAQHSCRMHSISTASQPLGKNLARPMRASLATLENLQHAAVEVQT